MSERAAQVTMVQRSPSYVMAWPEVDRVANALRKVLSPGLAYRLTRWKNIRQQQFLYRQSRKRPAQVRKWLLGLARKHVGPDFDMEPHLTPNYDPWDQRLCIAPDGDFFAALRTQKASIVTGHIERFTAKGLRLETGEEIEADIIVTATGLNMVILGEVDLVVDGEAIDPTQIFIYKGFAYSGIPNLCTAGGYVNASWTLRVDLIAHYVCRLLNHMESVGARQCTPRLRPSDHDMDPRRLLEGFTPGYIDRVMDQFPKQGDREPWLNSQDYFVDRARLLESPIDDGVMEFS
jgi:cation diffusion facilitator CzcD-associated flavoprotein CzcO